MPLYEHVIVARQDISPQQVETLIEGFTKVIEEGQGSVEKTEFCGLKTLAYKIKKNRKAHFVLLNLDASSEAVSELERQERLNEDIVRILTIRVDELDPNPSALTASRGRDDRGRRDDRGGPPRPPAPPRNAAETPVEKPAEKTAETPAVAADAAPAEESSK